MKIRINGEEREMEGNVTLAGLLEQFGLTPERGIAVAVNEAVVPRGELRTYRPREGDTIEIIRAVAGG
jgi:thiamine biosynthesis protein ThiS